MTGPNHPPLLELRGISLNSPGQSAGSRPGPRHRRQPSGRAALAPVDLVARSGELVTVHGRSGVGKTALLHLIALLERPVAGSYRLDGLDTAGLSDRDRAALRARRIGMVFQQPRLLDSRPVLDNVMLGLLYAGVPVSHRQRRALDALDQVGLADHAANLAGRLSAGQRRLASVARALAPVPDLLVCDNPTSDLDPGLATQVIGLLAGLHRDGRTVLLVTENQLAAAYATQRLLLGEPSPDWPGAPGRAGTDTPAAGSTIPVGWDDEPGAPGTSPPDGPR